MTPDDSNFAMVEIDKNKMVPMSNEVIQDRLLERYGVNGIKIVMIGVVGAYTMKKENYDHRSFIKFSVSNFAKLINKEEKYAIRIFKKACSDLRSKNVSISGYLDGEAFNFVSGILDTFAYSKNEKTLALKFEEHFIPHFMEMSGNFTKHELIYILNLDRAHTISFYQFLKMKIGKEFLNIIPDKDYFCEIDDLVLRQFFECENKYTQPRDFRSKVLSKVAEEITKGTDLTISFGQKSNSDAHVVCFSKKKAEQEPKNISLESFKFTKDRSSKKTVGDNKKALKPASKNKTVDEEVKVAADKIPPQEVRNSQPSAIGSLINLPKDVKIQLTADNLDVVAGNFINANSSIYNNIQTLINNGLCTIFKTEKDLLKNVFSVYQVRHGGASLEEMLKTKIHVIEQYFANAVAQSLSFNLASIGKLVKDLEAD